MIQKSRDKNHRTPSMDMMDLVMVMVTLFIHGKSFSNDIKKDKRLTNYT